VPGNEPTGKRDKLINRVVKLFRLGDAQRSHTTEGELLAAVTKARELMALHNIAMVEVEGQLDETKVNQLRIRVKEHSAYTRKGKFANYDHPIMTAVSILTDTEVYMQNSAGYQSAIFVGDETDAHIAGELYLVLLPSLRRFTRKSCGNGWSRDHTDYALGFGRRVIERSKDIIKLSKQQEQSMALVVTKKKDALTHYMKGLMLTPTKRPRYRHNSERYSQGYEDGSKMDLGYKRTIRGQSS
jgi:hypothetical protein